MRPPGNAVSQAVHWRSRSCKQCFRQWHRDQSRYASTIPRPPRSPHIASHGSQAFPHLGYYAGKDQGHSPFSPGPQLTRKEILGNPQGKSIAQRHEDSAKTSESDQAWKDEVAAKARVVFGSRLAGPIQRKAEIAEASKLIAGVLVPPRPGEPDNCCMSGCVNCVWDQYGEELEEWAEKSAEARAAVQKQRGQGIGTGMMTAKAGTPSHVASSMDDDGGGSETNWGLDASAAGKTTEDLFKDIPVGIREFMKTEKMLKEKHRQEGSA
ncbi:hypothetical protein P152DRAFT_455821 [Eremomyces bilateralis CBS 781.70]|uniref:Oxidoreductase-like domain-containing protein n=1 Tax=Eremomyces bilateralis CBS 781.70 TaxID=1392243 RepID=A0A6G1G9W8_9PEZI|nr:uncharacterized protein P152DRAFT_455821 [Eremomyces bilateralis CBS 781.70]KAF1814792.1 hypothetical protein P152DRAFT_455821 [Eremomyces bilateralis CBS 781.70]